MGQFALRDLYMAGVRWEITETSEKHDKIGIVPQNLVGAKASSKPVIIPASAPITVEIVKSMVNRPSDINSLIRMIGEFNHPLRNGATNVVMPNIAKNPNGLVIITDMPSTDDDLSGKILSGMAGEMIDKMLAAIEMNRDNVSIIPLIFWRTPGGRTPTREELDLVRPFIDKIMMMLQPKIAITLGTLATTEIGQTNLISNHGAQINNDNGYIVVPMYHPNYLILKPSAKRDVWIALQNVQKMLKNS